MSELENWLKATLERMESQEDSDSSIGVKLSKDESGWVRSLLNVYKTEIKEQSRLLGISGSREARLMCDKSDLLVENAALLARVERLRKALEQIATAELYGPKCTCSEDCSCGESYMRAISEKALSDDKHE